MKFSGPLKRTCCEKKVQQSPWALDLTFYNFFVHLLSVSQQLGKSIPEYCPVVGGVGLPDVLST